MCPRAPRSESIRGAPRRFSAAAGTADVLTLQEAADRAHPETRSLSVWFHFMSLPVGTSHALEVPSIALALGQTNPSGPRSATSPSRERVGPTSVWSGSPRWPVADGWAYSRQLRLSSVGDGDKSDRCDGRKSDSRQFLAAGCERGSRPVIPSPCVSHERRRDVWTGDTDAAQALPGARHE